MFALSDYGDRKISCVLRCESETSAMLDLHVVVVLRAIGRNEFCEAVLGTGTDDEWEIVV